MMIYAWMEEAASKDYMLFAIVQKDGKGTDAKDPLNIAAKCLVGQTANANQRLPDLNVIVSKGGKEADVTKILMNAKI